MIIFVVELIIYGTQKNPDEDFSSYYSVTFNENLFTSISIILVAYSFQVNFFPTYNNMRDTSNEGALKATALSIFFSMIIYLVISYLSIIMFGSDIYPNILDNISEYQGETTALILSVMFLIVIGCHIPFIFFGGKDCALNLYNELSKKQLSTVLEQKLLLMDTSHVNEEEQRYIRNSLKQLKDINGYAYYSIVCGTYFAEIILAIFVNDIGLVFEFVSAISCSTISFMIPALYVILSERKFVGMVQ